MKVGVIGLGKSGLSACLHLLKEGYTVFATDDKQTPPPEGAHFLPPQELIKQIKDLDFVVISPGVPLTHPVAVACKQNGIEVFCDVELAFRSLVGHLTLRAVGITGSNGKTTTTSLSTHILNYCGMPAKAVGNIGNPILTELEDTSKAFVVELSSFQLETTSSKILDASALLNISPNHLDRHGTMEEYTRVKERIRLLLKEGGVFWGPNGYSLGFDTTCDLYTDGKSIFYFQKKEAALPDALLDSFSHHTENFLAAYALTRHLGVDPEMASKAYDTFIKPKHRLEYVTTKQGIHFYDDSKATSVEAVVKAVESFSKPIVLIAGGVHKGYPYSAWKKAFLGKVKAVVLLGQAADIIEQDLEQTVPTARVQSLEEAIRCAQELAVHDDVVLLSCGCASYDMFTSFEERGTKFQELVRSL